MLALADRLTVPQIFFNERHIGGADETLKELGVWDEERLFPTPLDRYREEIGSLPDPEDPLLDIPRTPPVVDEPPPPRDVDSDSVRIPGLDPENVSVLRATRRLMNLLPRSDLSYHGTVYKNCFKGSDGVRILMKVFELEGEEEAILFGRRLQRRQILHHVTDDHQFNAKRNFFRLQPYHTPHILNTFRVWTDRVDEKHPMALVHRLKKLLGKVESEATDNSGKVDYLSAAEDPNYWEFEEAVCELQGIDMSALDGKTRLAFGMNLYNLMIVHAFIKVGTPSSTVQRSSFFGSVCYNIGGHVLSFSELENGVLRANSRAPYSLSYPFSRSDPRISLVLDKVDPRIHFGLNCGAKSCPPVKKYTADAIDEELRIVALSFCEQDENVHVDEEKNLLSLNMILSWYKSDFSGSTAKLPGKVVTYLRSEKKEMLKRMIQNTGETIKVKFNNYDWSTNASRSKAFDSSILKRNELKIRELLPL